MGLLGDQPQDVEGAKRMGWGSDAIVEQLSRLDIPYIALVPGSSYRGVHDSIVNYAGNCNPEMIVCLHEEHSIAIAHGYAKVTERPMAAAVHANVGLMHATMAIYNAFTDRVPMLVLGATGPVDSSKRRPWIDWVHTATDQAALIRHYIKFDDQPSSVPAAIKSVVRAVAMTSAKPTAPVYVCLDVGLQEAPIDPISVLDVSKFRAVQPQGPDAEQTKQLSALFSASKRPLLLFGRVNRQVDSWKQRVQLAEHYNTIVLTDLKAGCAFPTSHRLHPAAPSVHNSDHATKLLQAADLIVAFDWIDLAGTLEGAFPNGRETPTIVNCSMDSALHNGWSKDHFDLPPVDLQVFADPDKVVGALISELAAQNKSTWSSCPHAVKHTDANGVAVSNRIKMQDLAHGLYSALHGLEYSIVRLPLSWRGEDLQAEHPLHFLGSDGGGGLGSGPGMIVGAALALRGTGRIPVAILGDGDFLMGCSALWTAAKYRLPMLVLIANNLSFYNDVKHQERMANVRERPLKNKYIGMSLDNPRPDLAQLSASLGMKVIEGQVTQPKDLPNALNNAVGLVQQGHAVVVDILIPADDYGAALQNTS